MLAPDIFPKSRLGADYQGAAADWKGALAPDCRSLWDCVVKGQGKLLGFQANQELELK